MVKPIAGARTGVAPSVRKTARTFRITPGKIEAAQQVLGASTATEAIETALDMVVFRHELIQGAKAAFGIEFTESKRRRK
jgi:hypothetical protein